MSRKWTDESRMLDFDEEARALWARLNLEARETGRGSWNPIDAIYCHSTGRGKIYVGNQTAAENLTYLRSVGITHVVNCTFGASKIPNFHEGKLQYYTFPISHWQSYVNSTNASVIAFATPMFAFIEDAISSGGSVLVHCLAGAHRAGTTGVACLIHFADLDVATAIATAKSLRPIIDPIGQLPEFLKRLRRAYDAQGSKRFQSQERVAPAVVSLPTEDSGDQTTASSASEVEGAEGAPAAAAVGVSGGAGSRAKPGPFSEALGRAKAELAAGGQGGRTAAAVDPPGGP